MATTHLDTAVSTSPYSIPLLDASSLPSEEDWALLESISGYSEAARDFEPDADRLGRFRLTASFDE
jgi:hypothetical protein